MGTSSGDPQELLFTLPEPRQITLTGGLTDLSADVRLVTANVFPLYRKTMRTVLAAAGIRVVANKKRFIIDIRVESPETLDFTDVPAAAREEYYEIDLQDNAVTVRTATQLGALWGSHTLAGIYKAKNRGLGIPNLRLRDWPDHPRRAAAIANAWGLDRLAPEEWSAIFERLSAVKLNAVGLPLDGGWCAGRPGTFAPGPLLPFPEHPEADREIHLSWYSPNLKTWKADKYLPKFHMADPTTGDYLKQILSLAQENGLTPFPVVSTLGEATAIPRLLPQTAAQPASGARLQTFCLSKPETRTLLGLYYDGMLTRFFPAEGTPLFMLDLALPDPKALCTCPACKKKKPEQLLQAHLAWLASRLAAKGVQQILVNDRLPADLGQAVFSAAFAKELRKQGLFDRFALVTRAPAAAAKGKKAAAPAAEWNRWSAPDLEPAVWLPAEAAATAIKAAIPAGFKAGMAGTLLETMWDTQSLEVAANFANFAWRAAAPLPAWRPAAQVATLILGDDAGTFAQCLAQLGAAVAASPGSPLAPALRAAPFLTTVMPPNERGEYDFAAFADQADPKALRQHLKSLVPAAQQVMAALGAMLDRESKPADIELVRSLLCEAVRLASLGQTLDLLLASRELAAKKPDPKALKAVQGAHAVMLDHLLLTENRRNKLTAPLKLAEFSPLLGLAEQLQAALQEALGQKRKAVELNWSWKFPVLP
ncbi:MAG: glycoside hydrolase family 20 zincin-like fold domain-containing protein [Lentisphaeria bacterium]|jgi:hypothetical protein